MKILIKKMLNAGINLLAHLKGFHFPASFIWPWKVEYLLERYEVETTRFFKKNIKPGMVVIDVGANIGYFTRLFSKLVGKTGHVYSFEPDVDNWNLLDENSKKHPNITLRKEAVSNLTGSVDFFHVKGMTGTHTMLEVPDSVKYNVTSNTIDNFVRTNKIKHVDFIKVDVEGAEDKVFMGMQGLLSSENAPVVIFEYTPDTSRELFEELSKKYILRAINEDGTLEDIENIIFRQGKRAYANVILYRKK